MQGLNSGPAQVPDSQHRSLLDTDLAPPYRGQPWRLGALEAGGSRK